MSFEKLNLNHQDDIPNNTLNKSKSIDVDLETREDILQNARIKNPNRIILSHLNINSLRNKFEFLQELLKEKVDVLLISESKLDDSFTNCQFSMDGFYIPFRLDRSKNGGGLLLYVKNHIPCKVLNDFKNSLKLEHIFVEFHINSKKWLVSCSYNPHTALIEKHLDYISKGLDYYSSKYENFILLGDFNAQIDNEIVENFCSTYNLKSLVKEYTCFKSLQNPSCIDLILTNRPKSFQHSNVYETGLSDFHKLIFTVFKATFQKLKPRIIKYRDYKNFNESLFRNDLDIELSINLNNGQFSNVKLIADRVVKKHIPFKEKHVRGNQGNFMNKNLKKEMMTRSRLLNKFRKNSNDDNKTAYKKQRNYCVKLLRETKKEFYNNLDVRQITDNKSFWKTVKPNFSDKMIKSNNILLLDENKIVSKDNELVEIFNEYFGNIVKNLGIKYNNDIRLDNDPVINAIKIHEGHASIRKIKDLSGENNIFCFDLVTFDEVWEEIDKLDTYKTSQHLDIPTKIIKQNVDIFTPYFHESFNNMLEYSSFPNEMKNADVIPIFKKGSRTDRENYRPVSILPNSSKVFERLLFKQLSCHFEKILLKNQFGFRKGYSTQQCLLAMIEKLRKCIDHGGICGILLTDLSKAFDCLSHDLLIAKLHAYGVSFSSLSLIYSYLNNRFQRVKLNETYSSFTKIMYGVPQGSILGPLLFNIFLNDLFMFLPNHDIISYADDNTAFCAGKQSTEVLSCLEKISKILLDWFENNCMKANPDKCNFMISSTGVSEITVGNTKIQNSESEKLLGVR